MKITVKISGKTFEDAIDFPVKTPDMPNIQQALCTIPQKFATWMYLEAQAKAKLSSIEQKLDEIRAKIYLELSEKPAENGKKRTVEELKNAVRSDPKIVNLEKQYNDAANVLEAVKAARTIFQYYKDCVIELARSCRAEAEVLDSEVRAKSVSRSINRGVKLAAAKK